MAVKFNKQFVKERDRADKKIKEVLDKRLEIFLHALTGNYRGFRSINITGDWRAIYTENQEQEGAIFVALGTHSQLYG